MNISPLFFLVIIWIIMGLASSRKKAQQASRNAKPGVAKTDAKTQKAEPEKKGRVQPPAEPARPSVMQPTITVTQHDDSVYQGSMNAETGEGYDPCHDEQLSPLSAAEHETLAAPAEEAPGLQLGWTGNDIVRGFVMGEILGKRGKAS